MSDVSTDKRDESVLSNKPITFFGHSALTHALQDYHKPTKMTVFNRKWWPAIDLFQTLSLWKLRLPSI